MRRQSRPLVTAIVLATVLSCAACSTVPDPPAAVGDDYPGSCMPAEFTWPTDFLEALPSESSAVDGSEAEQSAGSGAYTAAHASGEKWPSPLIIEMTRLVHDGAAVWQVTTCDTATNEQIVMTVD